MSQYDYYENELWAQDTVTHRGTFAGIDVSAANSDSDYENRYADYNY